MFTNLTVIDDVPTLNNNNKFDHVDVFDFSKNSSCFETSQFPEQPQPTSTFVDQKTHDQPTFDFSDSDLQAVLGSSGELSELLETSFDSQDLEDLTVQEIAHHYDSTSCNKQERREHSISITSLNSEEWGYCTQEPIRQALPQGTKRKLSLESVCEIAAFSANQSQNFFDFDTTDLSQLSSKNCETDGFDELVCKVLSPNKSSPQCPNQQQQNAPSVALNQMNTPCLSMAQQQAFPSMQVACPNAVPPPMATPPISVASSPSTTPPTPKRSLPSTPSSFAPPADATLQLGDVEDVWYAERAFPPFTVQVNSPFPSENLKVIVNVVDGFGRDANDKVSASLGDRIFPVVNNQATVRGLRFCAVSSKNGGHFRFVVSLSASGGPGVSSPPFQILSYRLYHAPKVRMNQLQPDDSISKIKGIGAMYAKRLQAEGIETVRQLAQIDLQSMPELEQKSLLQRLRKDRGALTLTKLQSYITSAREIITKFRSAPQKMSDTNAHTHARLKKNQLFTPAPLSLEPQQPLFGNQHFDLVRSPTTQWIGMHHTQSTTQVPNKRIKTEFGASCVFQLS